MDGHAALTWWPYLGILKSSLIKHYFVFKLEERKKRLLQINLAILEFVLRVTSLEVCNVID